MQENLLAAAARMKTFYQATDQWLTAYDHNHLRISRIIRSLDLLVGKEEARTFLRDVLQRNERAGSPVNQRSLVFWREAADSRK